MLTAKEARKRTDEVIAQKELVHLEQPIEKAIDNGEYQVTVDFAVEDATRYVLETQYDYYVEVNNEERMTRIKW